MQTSDVVNSNGIISKYSQTLNEKGLAVSKLFPKGTILITIAANIGYAGILQKDMACPDSLIGLKCKTDTHNVFLNYLLLKEQPRMDYLAVAAAQKNINIDFLKPYKFYLPKIDEQEHISGFIRQIDERIATQNKIIEDYKLLKVGIMQKIFKQELRFKDENGCSFSEWKYFEFGEIYSFKSTNSLSRDCLNVNQGTIKNIHYGDIHTKYHSHFDVEKEIVPFINATVDIKRIANDCYLQEGDLVIADASEDYADIGKAVEIVNINNEKILAGLHTLLARRKNKHLAVGFAGHLMKNGNVRLAIMRIAQGTKVLGISTKRLTEVKLRIPSIAEQQKIASTLSAIDQKIELETAHIEKLKAQKQYLLQNLFV